jgi:DNA mismatch repair protein MutS2
VQGLVLTGPNGGGKTVILSTAGLAAHLARLAIPIPCAGARVDYFGSIVSDLGDAQSVADGMSSYAAHVRTCVEALSAAGLAGEGEGAAVGEEGGVAASGRGDAAPVGGAGHIEVGLISLPANLSPPSPTHSLYPCAPGQAALPTVDGSSVLVLLDEPGRGTDSDEGAAVAAAVMESLLESGARVLATTHAPLLKRFALSHPLLGVAAMGRDESTGAPTHRLLLGVVGHSHALDAAGRGGMPVPILRRARELLPGGGEVQTGAEEYVAALRVAVEKADAARRQAEGLRAAAVADRKAAAASAAAAAAELSRASGWLGAQQRRLDGQLNRLRREQERQDGGGKGGALELIGATVAALTLSRRSADDARARALETLGLAPLPADAPLRAGDAVVVLVSGQGAEYTEDGVVARDAPPGAVGVVVSMYGVECEVARGELAVWAAVAAT